MTNYSKLISDKLIEFIALYERRLVIDHEIAVRQTLEWMAKPEGAEDFKDFDEEPSPEFASLTTGDLELMSKGVLFQRDEIAKALLRLLEGAVRMGQPTIHLNIPQNVLNPE